MLIFVPIFEVSTAMGIQFEVVDASIIRLKMEAARPSETSVSHRNTSRDHFSSWPFCDKERQYQLL
jgi:hypothetical protein